MRCTARLLVQRTAPLQYPKLVVDKTRGPHGELIPMKNQGTDLDAWVYKVPDIRPDHPPELGFMRKRPWVPPIITSRLTLRVTKELHVRYCPFLIGGDQSVNGNVQRVIGYLNSNDCRKTNPTCVITVETVAKYMPPEYIVVYQSGKSYRLQEWSGAHYSEVIQALQRREYEEVADCLARDEDVDTFHFDEAYDQLPGAEKIEDG
eukprot:gene23015-35266_t